MLHSFCDDPAQVMSSVNVCCDGKFNKDIDRHVRVPLNGVNRGSQRTLAT